MLHSPSLRCTGMQAIWDPSLLKDHRTREWNYKMERQGFYELNRLILKYIYVRVIFRNIWWKNSNYKCIVCVCVCVCVWQSCTVVLQDSKPYIHTTYICSGEIEQRSLGHLRRLAEKSYRKFPCSNVTIYIVYNIFSPYIEYLMTFVSHKS